MTPPVKLFVVGVNWPPETFIGRKLHGLAVAGFDVTVCTPDVLVRRVEDGIRLIPQPRLRRDMRAMLAALGELARSAILAPRRALRAWAAAGAGESGVKERLARFLRFTPFITSQPDIVHFEWNSVAIEYLPFYDLFGCPVVVSCRGSQVQVAPHNPGRGALRAGLEESFRRAAAVHCVSEAIMQEAMQFGLDPAKARVIRPAVDPEFFRPAAPARKADGRFRVVTTGSLIWRKGYEYALQAIRRLVDREVDVQFDIIGDGPERQRVLYTIIDLGLEVHVSLCGRLTPAEVRSRLQQADAFLLSSLSEGISNAVLEAMACGLPVVTTNCGGMREAVSDGVEGFVVPTRDPEAMAEALHRLATDRALARAMGRAGRERVCREFQIEDQVKQFAELYRAI
ncbi:MAG TPA: glycosyltransferase family 4 protein [Aggregatilineales bacterium]|nr:glycosyltransferase family 4 protein [Aggregatilineales bacterium]